MHDQGVSSPEQILTHLINTVHRLRAPGGCPWDRAQTHQSLRPHLLEESYEVMDVLDQIHSPQDLTRPLVRASFQEELGDLLMQVLLHSEMANETGAFSIYDVARGLDDKLVRRHPHVFQTESSSAKNADQALKNWEREKAKEKPPQDGVLDSLPKNLPSLQKASRVIEKVTKVGFQWEDMEGPIAKVDEELAELKAEIHSFESIKATGNDTEKAALLKKVESEMGDLLFTLCNISVLMKINPEDALRSTLDRFTKRFRHVEKSVKSSGRTLEQSTLAEMDVFWNEAKKLEKVKIWGLTGGIGAGKSEAAKVFMEMGIPVVNADLIGKTILETHAVAKEHVKNRFGTTDKLELREKIFNDPEAKKALEEIVHPLVYLESLNQIRKLSEKHSVVLYEAAILIETGRDKDLAGLIVVEAPAEQRKARICTRDGISQELAQQMISAQITDEQRRARATHVLTNAGSLSELRKQIQSLKL